jgi:hypothetical protein
VGLRKRFDVEYFLGELDGQSYVQDLERLSVSPGRIEKELARVNEARKRDALLTRFLNDVPEPFSGTTALERRAMRIAVHVNLSRLADLLAGYHAPSADKQNGEEKPQPDKPIRQLLAEIAADEPRFSRELVTLRTFWLLNWLELDEYSQQLKEIAYTE